MSTPTGTRLYEGLDVALEHFLAQRPHLLRIARRVTGDAGTAEDVVQEAWVRWQRADRALVKNPAAFLTTTTTRLAINVVQSARRRHEVGPGPADPVDPAQDPTAPVDQTAAVEAALRALMARLRPPELTAYLLRKAFDYPYATIARLLRTSVDNARQLVRRGQQHIDGDRRCPVDAEAHRRLVATYLAASRRGRLADLEHLLTTSRTQALPGRRCA